jgi:hypothetical protein
MSDTVESIKHDDRVKEPQGRHHHRQHAQAQRPQER